MRDYGWKPDKLMKQATMHVEVVLSGGGSGQQMAETKVALRKLEMHDNVTTT